MVKYKKLKTRDVANNLLEKWLSFFDVNTPEEKEKALHDWTSSVNYAKREGREEGKLEIARKCPNERPLH